MSCRPVVGGIPDNSSRTSELQRQLLSVPFAVSLTVSGLAVALFVLLAYAVANPGYLTALDSVLADRLHQHAQSNPAVVAIFRPITALGSQRVLVCFAVITAVALSFSGRRMLSRVWLLVFSGGMLHAVLKPIVPRLRPQFADPLIVEPSLSFPSGHAMASLIGYGLLGYLLWFALPRGILRAAVALLVCLVILGVGFSRLYLGAHYFTDVLGGYAAGTAWLTVGIAGIEVGRRNGLGRPKSRSPSSLSS